MTRDKKRVEMAIKETENVKREVESDIRVKENKVKGMDGNVEPEILAIAELYYKLTLANFNLALSERKAAVSMEARKNKQTETPVSLEIGKEHGGNRPKKIV